jgi:hypothetical protein
LGKSVIYTREPQEIFSGVGNFFGPQAVNVSSLRTMFSKIIDKMLHYYSKFGN